MISLKNGVKIRLRIPPSIFTQESKLIYDCNNQNTINSNDFLFIKKWIYNTWYSKINSPKAKIIEKDVYINSPLFRRICGTKMNIGKLCQLFVKETLTKRGFLLKSYRSNDSSLSFDGIIEFNTNNKLLIKTSYMTSQDSHNTIHKTIFKYSEMMKDIKNKNSNIELLIILCGRQQDDEDSLEILKLFQDKNNNDSMISNSNIMDVIKIRDINDWIDNNLF